MSGKRQVGWALRLVVSGAMSQGVADEPEAGGGLMVAAIQLAIMLGAAFGGLLLDHVSISATWVGGAALLVLASFAAGNGRRLRTVPWQTLRRSGNDRRPA